MFFLEPERRFQPRDAGSGEIFVFGISEKWRQRGDLRMLKIRFQCPATSSTPLPNTRLSFSSESATLRQAERLIKSLHCNEEDAQIPVR
jgi:hypothetical protein